MPFGFKKGEKGEKTDELNTQKASLFSKGKQSRSPAPPPTNPYAVPPSGSNPYAPQNGNPYANQLPVNDPYAGRPQSSLTQPPTSSFGSLTLNSEHTGPPAYGTAPSAPRVKEKSPVPPGGYGGAAPRYPGGTDYGRSNGYGSGNPYGESTGPAPSQYGPGGYGAFGRQNSEETLTTDAGRDALFGDAARRAQNNPGHASSPALNEPPSDTSYANASGHDGYGQGRELTAEEQEEQEVSGIKQEIRFIKQESLASTDRSRLIVQKIIETGQNSMVRLNEQGDLLHNADSALNKAASETERATQKTKVLGRYDRSPFWLPVHDRPRTEKMSEQEVQHEQDRYRHHRATEQLSRESQYTTQQRHREQQNDLRPEPGQRVEPRKRDMSARAKYTFEGDSDEERVDNQTEDNLYEVHEGLKVIRKMGEAMGAEIAAQNKIIDRINGKVDNLDDSIVANRARLDRIGRR